MRCSRLDSNPPCRWCSVIDNGHWRWVEHLVLCTGVGWPEAELMIQEGAWTNEHAERASREDARLLGVSWEAQQLSGRHAQSGELWSQLQRAVVETAGGELVRLHLCCHRNH